MLTALLLLAAAAPQTADPLAEARAGKIQCVNPNVAAKTCMATGKFTVRPDGSFDSVATVMIAPTPLITMEVKASVKVVNGQVCGIVRKADYDAAVLKMDGAPVNDAIAGAVKAQMGGMITPMDGKNACSVDKPTGDMITAEVTLDGKPAPELNQKYIWVSPSEGYKIGG